MYRRCVRIEAGTRAEPMQTRSARARVFIYSQRATLQNKNDKGRVGSLCRVLPPRPRATPRASGPVCRAMGGRASH